MSGSGISWAIRKSAPRSRQITMPAPHHSSFLQAGCPSCHPTSSIKALKALTWQLIRITVIPSSDSQHTTSKANTMTDVHAMRTGTVPVRLCPRSVVSQICRQRSQSCCQTRHQSCDWNHVELHTQSANCTAPPLLPTVLLPLILQILLLILQ